MIVEPKIRGYICTTAHPEGCAKHVQNEIDYIKSCGPIANGPKKVLVIGASNGYGLSTRITAAFGSGASTIGVFYEKAAENNKRTATAGWYNAAAFNKAAQDAGLYAKNFNGDAFGDDMKAKVIQTIKEDWGGGVDLVVYSLASPRRIHPKTGELFKSVLKPREKPYTNKSIDFAKNEVIEVTLDKATEEEVQHTVAVMGGEDWEMWIKAMIEADLLADNCMTVAYTYVGPRVTQPVYRNGTIGAAKDHLEETGLRLDELMKKRGGRAFVSANKALVTQSSSAIPFIPLYFILLMKVMKEKGIHEGCIEQIQRLFSQRLYIDGKTKDDVPVDDKGIIRIDDWELREDVQAMVEKAWMEVDTNNVADLADLKGYHHDFLELFGFGLKGVDYQKDVNIDVPIN